MLDIVWSLRRAEAKLLNSFTLERYLNTVKKNNVVPSSMFFSSSLSLGFTGCVDHGFSGIACPGKRSWPQGVPAGLGQAAGYHNQPLVLQNKGLVELNRNNE
jgi:hypothetical protein